MSHLAEYTRRAKQMSDAELAYAVSDIKSTPAFRDEDPTTGYAAKLWAEYDAYIVEMANRCAAEFKRRHYN